MTTPVIIPDDDRTIPICQIVSVPIVDIGPVERHYICGLNACKLFYQRFRETTLQPKCLVLLIHGFGEHTGRFNHVIKELIENGCDVHTIDLRGHGLSGGPRADGNFDDFLDDIGQLHRVAVAASTESLPVFLYGQSMGGMLALAYAALDHDRSIRGVIATAPWLRLAPGVTPKWWKFGLLNWSWPLFQEFLISSNVDPCSLSTVDGVASAAINDRLVLPFITVRLAFQIMRGAKQTLQNAHNVQTPLLLYHGSSGQLTDASATAEFIDRAGSDDKTIRIFQGAYHEIHNNADSSLQLLLEMNQWIDERCSAQVAQTQPTRKPMADIHHGGHRSLTTPHLHPGKRRSSIISKSVMRLLIVYLVGMFLARRWKRTPTAILLWPVRLFYMIVSML